MYLSVDFEGRRYDLGEHPANKYDNYLINILTD